MDQNIRNKLNEIRQQQLESNKKLQSSKPGTTASDKSHKIAVLGGIAIGFITAWLMNSFLSKEDVRPFGQDSQLAIHENEIREANKTIEQLNVRVELLTKSISSLGAVLTQVMDSVEPDNKIVTTIVTDHGTPIPADEKPVAVGATSQAAGVTDRVAKEDKTFIPTHVVKTRLNLRTSTSMADAPIGVLNTGTKVSYIDEANGWYYVDTERLGKGWCASEYLSPLPPP